MHKPIITLKRVLLVFIGVMAGGLITAGVVGAAAVTRTASGNFSKFDATEVTYPQSAGNDEKSCVLSDTYEDMPGMSMTFTTTGFLSSKPAVIMFNAQNDMVDIDQGYATPNYAYARLLVDGNVQSGSGSEFRIVNQGMIQSSWQFVTDNLSAGTHTAKLQWHVDPRDGYTSEVCFKDSSMIAMHN